MRMFVTGPDVHLGELDKLRSGPASAPGRRGPVGHRCCTGPPATRRAA
ncbi:hypothetical protein [Amycolatopsis pithecellobii]|uniref:Uncharacterized protein n=1 Tax=Amycolatopsis pithecellobii TaxID=664692 RepID=A0A6N7Z8A7_9PSEU|nr:hypothetical protein [Amycolatopsis pithecellobii]MTD56616.1 hypothetical protein [Amycolatopsis pithecellobii]